MGEEAFQYFRGSAPPRFAHESEREFARALDEYGIPWDYEPHTFPLEYGPDGTVVEAFTPDFFLPEAGIYIELTTQLPSLRWRKRQKIRKARQKWGITVTLHERADLERLRVYSTPAVADELA
jgi:hypothetical protein